ncbi:hypothetical protein HSEST_0110 [Halapricum desulfuricans]|uniref:Uncharacterized protein n=1 Tax=Halapricum desulfuricans TaxID=2841257 RepID=A0A897NLQ5_9EURY|nr:hypothetical protein HSEST_0110 [Halapricum desulfuricans]
MHLPFEPLGTADPSSWPTLRVRLQTGVDVYDPKPVLQLEHLFSDGTHEVLIPLSVGPISSFYPHPVPVGRPRRRLCITELDRFI